MKKLVAALAIGLIQATATNAAPALFKDSIMYIREGIVLLGEEIRYYRNIQMEVTDKGEFRAVQGEELQPAQIDELDITVLYTDPAQVELKVSGNMSTPCIDLVTAVRRDGNTFYVAVAELPWQTSDVCIQVLEPYDQLIDLDGTGLSAGEYLVKVNDKEIDFELEVGDPPHAELD